MAITSSYIPDAEPTGANERHRFRRQFPAIVGRSSTNPSLGGYFDKRKFSSKSIPFGSNSRHSSKLCLRPGYNGNNVLLNIQELAFVLKTLLPAWSGITATQ